MIDVAEIQKLSLAELWNFARDKAFSIDFNTKDETAEQVKEILVAVLTDPIIKIMDELKDGKI